MPLQKKLEAIENRLDGIEQSIDLLTKVLNCNHSETKGSNKRSIMNMEKLNDIYYQITGTCYYDNNKKEEFSIEEARYNCIMEKLSEIIDVLNK